MMETSLTARYILSQSIAKYTVAIIGDSGVGKTALVNRYLFQKFEKNHSSTIEDFYQTSVKLNSDS